MVGTAFVLKQAEKTIDELNGVFVRLLGTNTHLHQAVYFICLKMC